MWWSVVCSFWSSKPYAEVRLIRFIVFPLFGTNLGFNDPFYLLNVWYAMNFNIPTGHVQCKNWNDHVIG